jgi:hypothetical protein
MPRTSAHRLTSPPHRLRDDPIAAECVRLGHGSATGHRRVRWTRLMWWRRYGPLRTRTQRNGCCYLMLIGGILSGTARQALTYMCVSRFPKIPERMPATRQARHRSMPFGQHSRFSAHTRPRLPRGMRQYGRAGRAGPRLLKRRGWRFPIGRCCCSAALSTHSETHQLWLGTGLRQASIKNRTSCGRRIMPGVWLARSMRRSSSPWVVPGRRPRLWLEPCRALSGECVTGNRLRCTATRHSPSSSARSPSRRAPGGIADVDSIRAKECKG